MATSTTSVSKHFPKPQDGFTTTTSGSISSGATSVGLNSTGSYANGDVVVLIIDPTDASKKQAFTGTVDTSGVQITGVVWTSGTNQNHSAGATVVDYVSATHLSMISKGLLVGHSQTGVHASALPLTSPVLTTPVITDYTSATHTHATNAQGGQLGASAIATGTALADKLQNPYKFSVYRSAAWNTSTANQFNKVAFDTKLFDTGTNFDVVTNNRFVAPVAGFYQFSSTVKATTNNAYIQIALYKNGSVIKNGTGANNDAGSISSGGVVSGLLQLAVSDYIEVYFFNNGTNDTGLTGTSNTFFDGYLVSAT